MSSRNLLIVLVLIVGGGIYYKFFHLPNLLREATEQALMAFSEAVSTRDRARVAEVLKKHLDEQAKIHLEVTYLSLTQKGSQPVKQDFEKPTFVTFVDNILFSLEAFEYMPRLEEFDLNEERNAADVVFTSQEWGDGKSFYAGIAVMMRFSSNTRCEGKVAFQERLPLLRDVSCAMSMRAVPKPEEAHKLQGNPEAMQQFLLR